MNLDKLTWTDKQFNLSKELSYKQGYFRGKRQVEKLFDKIIDEVKNRKFPLGENPWCDKCKERILKEIFIKFNAE